MSMELTKFPLTLSARLRTTFDEVLPAPLPERLAALMHRLNTDEGEPDHGAGLSKRRTVLIVEDDLRPATTHNDAA